MNTFQIASSIENTLFYSKMGKRKQKIAPGNLASRPNTQDALIDELGSDNLPNDVNMTRDRFLQEIVDQLPPVSSGPRQVTFAPQILQYFAIEMLYYKGTRLTRTTICSFLRLSQNHCGIPSIMLKVPLVLPSSRLSKVAR